MLVGSWKRWQPQLITYEGGIVMKVRTPRIYKAGEGIYRVPVWPCELYGSASEADCRDCNRYEPYSFSEQCRYKGHGYRYAERTEPR